MIRPQVYLGLIKTIFMSPSVHLFDFVILGKDSLRDALRRRGPQDIRHLGFPQGCCRWLHGDHDADPVQAGHHRDGALPLLLRRQLPALSNPAIRVCSSRLQLGPRKLRFVWVWLWSGIASPAWLRYNIRLIMLPALNTLISRVISRL